MFDPIPNTIPNQNCFEDEFSIYELAGIEIFFFFR